MLTLLGLLTTLLKLSKLANLDQGYVCSEPPDCFPTIHLFGTRLIPSSSVSARSGLAKEIAKRPACFILVLQPMRLGVMVVSRMPM